MLCSIRCGRGYGLGAYGGVFRSELAEDVRGKSHALDHISVGGPTKAPGFVFAFAQLKTSAGAFKQAKGGWGALTGGTAIHIDGCTAGGGFDGDGVLFRGGCGASSDDAAADDGTAADDGAWCGASSSTSAFDPAGRDRLPGRCRLDFSVIRSSARWCYGLHARLVGRRLSQISHLLHDFVPVLTRFGGCTAGVGACVAFFQSEEAKDEDDEDESTDDGVFLPAMLSIPQCAAAVQGTHLHPWLLEITRGCDATCGEGGVGDLSVVCIVDLGGADPRATAASGADRRDISSGATTLGGGVCAGLGTGLEATGLDTGLEAAGLGAGLEAAGLGTGLKTTCGGGLGVCCWCVGAIGCGVFSCGGDPQAGA